MGMTVIGIDKDVYNRLAAYRRPNEDIDWTINRLMNAIEKHKIQVD